MTSQILKMRMTSQILKKRMTSQFLENSLLAIALSCMAFVNIHAQDSSMQELMDQSLTKLEQSKPESYLNYIAELKRIDAMFPDSIQPKYQTALQCLVFSVTNPHATQTTQLLAEAEQAIGQMAKMNHADPSDLNTLYGFLYMARIVQDPAQNGQRYYLDVMRHFEKALKLNPNNELARQLQEKFYEGMKQATGE